MHICPDTFLYSFLLANLRSHKQNATHRHFYCFAIFYFFVLQIYQPFSFIFFILDYTLVCHNNNDNNMHINWKNRSIRNQSHHQCYFFYLSTNIFLLGHSSNIVLLLLIPDYLRAHLFPWLSSRIFFTERSESHEDSSFTRCRRKCAFSFVL